MKSATGLCVLMLALSCSPKKSISSGEQSTVSGAPVPQQNASLTGVWRSCIPYPEGAIIGVKSSSLVYTFEAGSRATMQADFYTDEACLAPFTQAKAEDTFKLYESLGQAPAPSDVKSAVFDLVGGMTEEMNYLATSVPAGERGTLDFVRMEKPSFTSYRIWNDTLEIDRVCHEPLEEECEATGDSAINRALDLDEAEILVRVK